MRARRLGGWCPVCNGQLQLWHPQSWGLIWAGHLQPIPHPDVCHYGNIVRCGLDSFWVLEYRFRQACQTRANSPKEYFTLTITRFTRAEFS